MIEKLLTNSRVTEIDAATRRIISAFEKNGPGSDPHLAGIFSELKPLSASLNAAIRQSKAESNLDAYDVDRDDELRGLHYLILGYLHNPDPVISEAAKKVAKVFNKYGVGIATESYATQSSLVNSMLEDLTRPELQEPIAAMPGCAKRIASLQAAQTKFETARVDYETEKANDATRETATAIKKSVLKIINDKLVVFLRAMVQVDEATYSKFGRIVGEIIDENNETVRRRQKEPDPAV
ncbi:MAG: DUF6261 family protein [Tangfeifania sp.]